jgi:hypothetical protein
MTEDIDPNMLVQAGKNDIFKRIVSLTEDIQRIRVLEEAITSPYFQQLATTIIRERTVSEKPRALIAAGKTKTWNKLQVKSRRFANSTMDPAILEVVGENPGLSAREIAEKLFQGGYPFTTPRPETSVATAVRQLQKKGQLNRVLGKKKPEKGATINRYHLKGAHQ